MSILKNPLILSILSFMISYYSIRYYYFERNTKESKIKKNILLISFIVSLVVFLLSHYLCNKNNDQVISNDIDKQPINNTNPISSVGGKNNMFYIGNDGSKLPRLDVYVDMMDI
jgi:hypothetical protein